MIICDSILLMFIYDTDDLDEAMNAIKEEMMKDRTESLLQENKTIEYNLEPIEIK